MLCAIGAKTVVRQALDLLQGEHMDLALHPTTKVPYTIDELDKAHGCRGDEEDQIYADSYAVKVMRELYLPRMAFAGRRDARHSYDIAAEQYKQGMQALKMLRRRLQQPSRDSPEDGSEGTGCVGGLSSSHGTVVKAEAGSSSSIKLEGGSSGGSSSSSSSSSVLAIGYERAVSGLKTNGNQLLMEIWVGNGWVMWKG